MATAEPLSLPADPDALPEPVAEWLEASADPDAPRPPVDPRWGPRLARWRLQVERRRRRLMERYEAERRALDLWRDRELQLIERERVRVDSYLADLLWAERREDPRRKTLQLPGVTVAARAQPDEWVRDEDALLQWCAEHAPEFVAQRPTLQWAKLKRAAAPLPDGRAALRGSGEVLPSVQVVQRPEEVHVTVHLEGEDDGGR